MSQPLAGIDAVELARVGAALERHGERFLRRIYTPLEVAFCRGRLPELAARFAAKEAVMKALGTGARGLRWRDIEVLPDRRGKPLVYLHGGAFRRGEVIGLEGLDISLTHSRELALALVTGFAAEAVEQRDVQRQRLAERLLQRGLISEEEFGAALEDSPQ